MRHPLASKLGITTTSAKLFNLICDDHSIVRWCTPPGWVRRHREALLVQRDHTCVGCLPLDCGPSHNERWCQSLENRSVWSRGVIPKTYRNRTEQPIDVRVRQVWVVGIHRLEEQDHVGDVRQRVQERGFDEDSNYATVAPDARRSRHIEDAPEDGACSD